MTNSPEMMALLIDNAHIFAHEAEMSSARAKQAAASADKHMGVARDVRDSTFAALLKSDGYAIFTEKEYAPIARAIIASVRNREQMSRTKKAIRSIFANATLEIGQDGIRYQVSVRRSDARNNHSNLTAFLSALGRNDDLLRLESERDVVNVLRITLHGDQGVYDDPESFVVVDGEALHETGEGEGVPLSLSKERSTAEAIALILDQA